MALVDRIRTQRDLDAMVALDTIDMIAERVTNLLGHGRRMTIVRRYTYIDRPPTVTAGLTLDGEPKSWKRDNGAGFSVHLKPGIMSGFGFSCYAHDGSTTEAEAWARFHAAESQNTDPWKRRRDMTEVQITGGLPGDGPARDDQLIIRHWNDSGVCDEVVVAFDYDTRSGTTVTLTRAQWETIDSYKALNTPAEWFIGEPNDEGTVTVIAVGGNYIWSFTIEADGECASHEATFDENGWQTGINC